MSTSFPHEALVELFRNRPLLAAELLRDRLPLAGPLDAELGPNDLGELAPTELRADAVVRLRGPPGRCAVVVEVQLADDPAKSWSWPAYLANLRARERSDVLLLVLTLDAALAGRLARPIPLGHPGFALTPLVLGPTELPVITDREEAARSPELAVLSALAHGRGPQAEAIGRAAIAVVDRLDDTRAGMYVDLVLASLEQAARQVLEALMHGGYQFQSEFMRNLWAKAEAAGMEKGIEKGIEEGIERGIEEGIEEGLQRGERALLLRVLGARFGPLPAEALRRLEAASTPELERWAEQVFSAPSLEALLAG